LPKRVDHGERRTAIVEALFRVVERGGLPAASIRAVAAEAGVRAPQVQNYFPAKADLLAAALDQLGRRVVGRGMDLMQAAGDNPTPEALLRAAVQGSHPVDDASRQDLVLFFAFLMGALTETDVAQTGLIDAQKFFVQQFAEYLRDGQARGEVPREVDPEREARLILFANTGLILAALAGIHSVADAEATLDYHLSRVFPQQKKQRR
jgi:AcrR family transcriptional regulator